MAPSVQVLPESDPFPSITPDPQGHYYSKGLRARFQLDAAKVTPPGGGQAPPAQTYADITYEVDEERYLRRQEAVLKTPGLPTSVPEGWPTLLEGPLVWDSNSFPDEREYVYYLTDGDKVEIQAALGFFKSMYPPCLTTQPWTKFQACIPFC